MFSNGPQVDNDNEVSYPPSSYSPRHYVGRPPPSRRHQSGEQDLPDHNQSPGGSSRSGGGSSQSSPQSQSRRTKRVESPFDDRHSISAQDAAKYHAAAGRPTRNNMGRIERAWGPTMQGPDSIQLSRRERTDPGYIPTHSPPISPSYPLSDLHSPPLQSPAKIWADAPPINPPEADTPFPDLPSPTPLQIVKPSLWRLFTLLSWSERLPLLLPAIFFALGSSAVAPLMSLMVGNAFGALAAYPLSMATPEDKRILMHDVGLTSMRFAFIGAGAVVLEYFKQVTWTRFSEATTARLRRKVFYGVRDMPMEWFDTGMGMKQEPPKSEGSAAPAKSADSIGAGGLMNKFARETDEVRMATGGPSSSLIQGVSTVIICVIMSMRIQPLLALVSLASVPIIILVTTVAMQLAQPSLVIERRAGAEAATNVQRATGAIETVKGHNAQADEHKRFMRAVNTILGQIYRQSWLFPTVMGTVEFSSLGMFVASFWFGAKLINEGKATVAEVQTVFWSCMFAATALQGLSRLLTPLLKGSTSLASMLTVVQERPAPAHPIRPRFVPMVRRHPRRCLGGFELKEVFFSYPSRLEEPVLRGINLFLPQGETTFVVGGNGSGKSTIAQLLLRLYKPSGGEITLDDHDLDSYDEAFTSCHIALVSQGCVLFDMSVHDNVALGVLNRQPTSYGVIRRPKDVTRQEVIEACKMAHIHDFVESLPQGYDTMLENNGAALSGGQRQRLAIARAKLRDPTVLVLDEATRALDPTSRVAVFENIKKWRKNSTTIVISHDLSQITPDDFVYVMKNGHVVEQGYRKDLMSQPSEFASMAAHQIHNPVSDDVDFSWKDGDGSEVGALLDGDDRENDYLQRLHTTTGRNSMHPVSGNWNLDILEEYDNRNRRSSLFLDGYAIPASLPPSRPPSRQNQRRATSALVNNRNSLYRSSMYPEKDMIEVIIDSPGSSSSHGSPPKYRMSSTQPSSDEYPDGLRNRRKGDSDDTKIDPQPIAPAPTPEPLVGFVGLARRFYPTMPSKYLLFIGLICAITEGVSMPVWSFFLAKVLALLGHGTVHEVTMKALTVLGVTAGRALSIWGNNFCLLRLSGKWQASMRAKAFDLVLKQDKSWFDDERHGASAIAHSLSKDIGDMGPFISQVIAGMIVVVVMVVMSVIWAMVSGWQLTLVGLALGPVIMGISTFANARMAAAEKYNKARRDAVSQTFYEYIANVLGIRCMSLESHFADDFERDATEATRQAQRAVWLTAIGPGVSAGMMLFAQALMNYAGAMFIRDGIITFADMLSVYTLILFGISQAVITMGFLPRLTKAKVAARDSKRFTSLSSTTREIRGDQRFPIAGNVTFNHVTFAYPSRPEVVVLRNLTFTVSQGECVAIVGPSGSGKSTVAALLQRLYEPTSGAIIAGSGFDIANAEVSWLRSHIAIVSQKDNLFDGTVAENIRYGSDATIDSIKRAAGEAHIHDFIVTRLPKGYDEGLGENAALLSGGQRQRLQLARALVRPSNILILDECTSQLDPESQRAVLDTIGAVKRDRTTFFITHSKEAMQRCDRIICLQDGSVAETGTYEDLIRKGGVFANLINAGEVQE